MNIYLMQIWYTMAYMQLVVLRHAEGCQANLVATINGIFSLLLLFFVIYVFLTEAVVSSGQWGGN